MSIILKKPESALFAMIKSLKEFPYLSKWIVLTMDLSISLVAFILSYLICYNLIQEQVDFENLAMKSMINLLITLVFYVVFRTYAGIIRHSTFYDTLKIFLAITCSNTTMYAINLILVYYNNSIFPSIGFFINFTLTFVFIFTARMSIKLFYDYAKNVEVLGKKKNSLLIYGISTTNIHMAKMINNSPKLSYSLMGFVVTDVRAADKILLNVPVFYEKGGIDKILSKLRPDALLIHPEELDRKVKNKIADKCIQYKVELLSSPVISEWKNKKKPLKEVKKIKIEDLLGRQPIEINTVAIGKALEGKCVLVTGAAGSIGSEITRQIGNFNPGRLILCDTAETPIHQLQLELQENFPHLQFQTMIADVRSYRRMEFVFKKYKPQFIYHAAAYKHVPLMEEYPCESILTNVAGTKNMADLSVKYGAETFVMISTDKAVNPTNVMGASKRIAEMYVQSLDKELHNGSEGPRDIRFITTRFGNVLGSNGSVIPRFKEQILKGGPVTVTHPKIIRYFMTIPEACRLVLEAGNMGNGGEIFVFDMGEPVKIVDLAERMIRLSGYKPYIEINIEFTGLRPGEKLYEELLTDMETTKPTHNSKIMIGTVREYNFEQVQKDLVLLTTAAEDFRNVEVVKIMKKLVPEFKSSNSKYEVLDSE